MKKLLIIILIFATVCIAQITDASILNIKSLQVDYSNPVITVLNSYEELREASPIIEHNGKLIWLTTFVKDGVFSLHRFESSINDDKNWEYKGKLILWGQDGEMEGEDATFAITPTGAIHLLCENKSYEKSHGMYTIGKFIASGWNSYFIFQGGSTGIVPFGDGKAKDAVYTPYFYSSYLDPIYFDGRSGVHEENIFWAYWNGTKYIPDPEPLFTVDDISQPIKNRPDSKVVTTGIAKAVHEVEKSDGSIKYIMEIVAYKDWSYEVWQEAQPNVYNGYWSQGLAISDSLRSGWVELDSEIKDQNGKNVSFQLFYNNGWKAFASSGTKKTDIYFAEIVTGTQPEPPDPDNPYFLPDDVPGVSYNTVLMRELRPLVLGFTLSPEEEKDRTRTINLLDEVGIYVPFDQRKP